MTRMILLCLALSPLAIAQVPNPHHIPNGAKIYIEPMNGFETYLAAAFQKKEVPVIVVGDRAQADYILSGGSDNDKASWAKTIFVSPLPHSSASLTLKSVKGSEIIWAYAVDKKNAFRANQSTAEACAKHMKHDVFEKQEKW